MKTHMYLKINSEVTLLDGLFIYCLKSDHIYIDSIFNVCAGIHTGLSSSACCTGQ